MRRKVFSAANVLTGARIVCALILIFCPTFSVPFYVLYAVCGVSDVLDGIAARHGGKETAFGARFDTAADIVFAVTATVKTVCAVNIPTWLVLWIVFIAVIKIVNIIIGLVVYKKLVCEHTVMNKICGVLLFAVPLCVGRFPRQAVAITIISVCGIATFAAVQEGYCIRTGKEIR